MFLYYTTIGTKFNNSNVIDLNNLDELEENGNGQVVIEDITYEEFIEEISKEQGISQEQARKLHKNPNSNTNPTGIQSRAASINTYVMKKISIVQDVGWNYKPSLIIYAYTYSSGSFREFKYIEAVNMDRDGVNDNYTPRLFEGVAKAKLINSIQIFWYIFGDFYDYGDQTMTGGVGGSSSTVGKEVQANFSITRKTNHFEYWDDEGTYSLY